MKAWNPRKWGIQVVDLDFGDGPSDRELVQAAVHGCMGAMSTAELEGGRESWPGNPRGGLDGYPDNNSVQRKTTKRRT